MLRRRLNCINGTKSPSSRRAWIEIADGAAYCASWSVALLAEGVDRNHPVRPYQTAMPASPSSRRAWIEIENRPDAPDAMLRSPSSRRAWIEIADEEAHSV